MIAGYLLRCSVDPGVWILFGVLFNKSGNSFPWAILCLKFKEDHEKLSSLCKISHGKVLTICFPIITLTSFNFLPVLPNFRILFNKTCEVGISDEKFERDVE